jgi:hypothetical protein
LGLTTNYAVITDEPSQVVLDNTTASIDQQELISYRRRRVGTVNTDLNIQYPAPVKGGVTYAYQIEETVVETTAAGDRYDHPVKLYLTVVHDMSGVVTNADLSKTLRRLLSAIPVDSTGDFVLLNTARGALRP